IHFHINLVVVFNITAIILKYKDLDPIFERISKSLVCLNLFFLIFSSFSLNIIFFFKYQIMLIHQINPCLKMKLRHGIFSIFQ
ncbi:hypothetical protein B9P78_09430, partial [Aerococcus sp. 1KP-2016]